jgi:hypothetical protein
MMQKNNDASDNINVTATCVYDDIRDANACYNLLFIWINGLLTNEKFYRTFNRMFFHVRDALETKYILALSKLFARSSEAGLWRLIIQAKAYPVKVFDLRLEREPGFLQGQIKRQRKYFFSKYSGYVNKINKIRGKINTLRNKQKAHNISWMPDGVSVTWKETKEWLTLAEKIYFYAMTAICHTATSEGLFIPKEINDQMEHFVSVIKN